MAKEETTLEDKVRESFRETIVVLERLSPLCNTVDELRDMLQLALTNEGQLTLLINQLSPLRTK